MPSRVANEVLGAKRPYALEESGVMGDAAAVSRSRVTAIDGRKAKKAEKEAEEDNTEERATKKKRKRTRK